MKDYSVKIILAAVILTVAVPFVSASSQQYVLIAKASPADGGVVKKLDNGSGVVTLSATAKDGYQFVYWLGDVADPSAQTTTVSKDAPRLVVAVYERTDFPYQISTGAGGAGGIMNTASRARRSSPGIAPGVTVGAEASAPGGSPNRYPSFVPPEVEPDEMNPDVSVPDEEVPEPTTLVLFGLAGLKLLRRSNRN